MAPILAEISTESREIGQPLGAIQPKAGIDAGVILTLTGRAAIKRRPLGKIRSA